MDLVICLQYINYPNLKEGMFLVAIIHADAFFVCKQLPSGREWALTVKGRSSQTD